MPLIVKPTPAHPEPPAHKIMPAFATRFGPKLAGEVAATDRLVRVNALTALCDALSDPEQAHGCAGAGYVHRLGVPRSGRRAPPAPSRAAMRGAPRLVPPMGDGRVAKGRCGRVRLLPVVLWVSQGARSYR